MLVKCLLLKSFLVSLRRLESSALLNFQEFLFVLKSNFSGQLDGFFAICRLYPDRESIGVYRVVIITVLREITNHKGVEKV